MINRRSQTGILLEIFLLILILALFVLLWNTFSRTTFLAGLNKIDDDDLKFTCSKMVQVIVGTDYIMSYSKGSEVSQALVDYLGFNEDVQSIPDAQYFLDKIVYRFPDLTGRVGVTVNPKGLLDVGHSSAGVTCNDVLAYLSTAKCTQCFFQLYSTNNTLSATISLQVII